MNPKEEKRAAFHSLSPEQRAQVDRWLFEERLGCREVADRCGREFGVEAGKSSVSRYCQREGLRRALAEYRSADGAQGANRGQEGEDLYQGLLGRVLEAATAKAHDLEDQRNVRAVKDFLRVCIAARRESHEALRAATTREKFEFDAATACLIHQVKMQSIAADEMLDDGERIMKIRQELFGTDLPE